MKRKKSQLEIVILYAMMEEGLTWEQLSLDSGGKPDNGHNLNKQIKNKSVGNIKLVNVCNRLKLDIGEIYKLLIS